MNHELATKQELATALAALPTREEFRRGKLELCAMLRQDMRQLKRELTAELTAEMVSHFGALGERITAHVTQELAALEKRWSASCSVLRGCRR